MCRRRPQRATGATGLHEGFDEHQEPMAKARTIRCALHFSSSSVRVGDTMVSEIASECRADPTDPDTALFSTTLT